VLNEIQARHTPHDYESIIHPDNFNQIYYSSPQIFSYLADHLANISKKTNIVYVGHNSVLLNMLSEFTQKMQFINPITVVDTLNKVHVQKNTVYIFDFGFDVSDTISKHISMNENRKILKDVMNIFLKTANEENSKQYQNKFIGINVLYTDFRAIFRTKILTGITSHNTNISYGYVRPAQAYQVAFKVRLKYFYLRNKGYFLQYLHYVTARHFFEYSDKIRKVFIRSPIAKYFIKS
jgi:hypothetical protein